MVYAWLSGSLKPFNQAKFGSYNHPFAPVMVSIALQSDPGLLLAGKTRDHTRYKLPKTYGNRNKLASTVPVLVYHNILMVVQTTMVLEKTWN